VLTVAGGAAPPPGPNGPRDRPGCDSPVPCFRRAARSSEPIRRMCRSSECSAGLSPSARSP